MKSHSIDWTTAAPPTSPTRVRRADRLNRILALGARVFSALVAALGLIVTAIWASTLTPLAPYLAATVWASGFVFMALAIEASRPGMMGLHLATGIALFALALLSDRIASEFSIIAAVLMAAWIARAILRR